jgi:hypothetical protein
VFIPYSRAKIPTSVIRERLAWNGVALSFPCNLATCACVTLSALFAPSYGLMILTGADRKQRFRRLRF